MELKKKTIHQGMCFFTDFWLKCLVLVPVFNKSGSGAVDEIKTFGSQNINNSGIWKHLPDLQSCKSFSQLKMIFT